MTTDIVMSLGQICYGSYNQVTYCMFTWLILYRQNRTVTSFSLTVFVECNRILKTSLLSCLLNLWVLCLPVKIQLSCLSFAPCVVLGIVSVMRHCQFT